MLSEQAVSFSASLGQGVSSLEHLVRAESEGRCRLTEVVASHDERLDLLSMHLPEAMRRGTPHDQQHALRSSRRSGSDGSSSVEVELLREAVMEDVERMELSAHRAGARSWQPLTLTLTQCSQGWCQVLAADKPGPQ